MQWGNSRQNPPETITMRRAKRKPPDVDSESTRIEMCREIE